MAKKKRVPRFRSDDEKREFRAKHDSAEVVDWQPGGKLKVPELTRRNPKSKLS
jgi:hypothetical protein